MTRRRACSPQHVSVRLSPETIARIDTLADQMTPVGAEPSRSIAIRAVLLRGLATLDPVKVKVEGET